MKIKSIDNLEEQFVWKDNVGLVTNLLGEAAGSQKLYVNIDNVPPKAFSTKYHSHSQQEEFFVILEGCGTLRLNGKEYQVEKGNFISKPAAQNIAHTFYNSGNSVLVILDVGTVEKEDTCYYPDEDIYLHKSNGVSNVFKKQSAVNDWSSAPNGSIIESF
ncbi:MAG: cupin domain-containing protein [Lachnospiraceae bacterium]